MRNIALMFTAVLALTSAEAASAQTRVQPKPTTPAPVLQAPVAKPDLVVIKAVRGPDYPNGQGRIFVQVKNVGSAAVAQSQSLATHDNTDGCGTYFSVPPLAPGAVSSHTIRYCEDIAEGTRIRVIVDENQKVAESKENNNVRHFNW